MTLRNRLRYLFPITMAAAVGAAPLSYGQEGVPEVAVDDSVEVKTDAEVETPAGSIDANLAGEAPATAEGEATVDADAEVTSDESPVETRDERIINRRGAEQANNELRRAADALSNLDARYAKELGLRYEPIDDVGFRISGLDDNSITARAGFRVGDRVLRIGENRVQTWPDFRRAMVGYYGQRAPVFVIREGRTIPVYIDLTDYEVPLYLRADYDPSRAQRAGFGIGLNHIDGLVVVSRVYPRSPAALAGMRVGDVIIATDGREVDKLADVTGYIRSLSPGDDIVLQVRRAGDNVRVAARLATWSDALDTAPHSDLLHAELPDQRYLNQQTRINALEERIQILEAAVRGLRNDLSGEVADTTAPARVDQQQRDVELETVPSPPPALP